MDDRGCRPKGLATLDAKDMRFDQLPQSKQIEDRRGQTPRGVGGRAGGIGIGTLLLLGALGWALGINPVYLIGGAEILSGLRGPQQEAPQPMNRGADAGSD